MLGVSVAQAYIFFICIYDKFGTFFVVVLFDEMSLYIVIWSGYCMLLCFVLY